MTVPSGAVLDHIAVAVNSIDISQKIYKDLGLTFSDNIEMVESQKVKTMFASLGSNEGSGHLELLEPIGIDGPISNFLKKNGEGIHHIAFKVNDILATCEELVQKGYRLLYDRPVVGANNKIINFIHPKSAGGVLIEISEEAK